MPQQNTFPNEIFDIIKNELELATEWRHIVKNQKPNSRSRSGTPKNKKHRVPNRSEQSQNPPEIIVLPDQLLPNNKPNIEPVKPIETPVEDKPSGEKPSNKK